MARVSVVRSGTSEKVPFLRGILVQSLVDAGLSFKEAYQVAQVIRDHLSDVKEISTDELHRHVAYELEERFGPRAREAYERGADKERQILVRKGTHTSVFSVGLTTRSLEACAIGKTQAFNAVQRAQKTLREGDYGIVDHLDLRRIIYESLREEGAPAAADRYLSWRQFRESGDPLILLLGGVPGTGKSTMAAELAYRLDVVGTQSTDLMRELIRCYLGQDAAPTLGYSSFEAWRGLAEPGSDPGASAPRSRVVEGFLSQFREMKAGLVATIQRAVKERQDLILDGVHVVCSELDLAAIEERAIVVPVMLLVATRQELASRFKARGEEQPGRGSARYLQSIDAIWDLQSYLLGEADGADIPLVVNRTHEETVLQVTNEVSRRVAARYPPDPEMLSAQPGVARPPQG